MEELEIYWDLFCGGARPKEMNPDDLTEELKHMHVSARVISMDEWNRMQKEMIDEERIAYER